MPKPGIELEEIAKSFRDELPKFDQSTARTLPTVTAVLTAQMRAAIQAIRRFLKRNVVSVVFAQYLGDQIPEATRAGVISKSEASDLENYHQKVKDLLAVDDFAPEELVRAESKPVDTKKKAKKTTKKTTKKTAKKTTTKTAGKKSSSKKKSTRKKKAE